MPARLSEGPARAKALRSNRNSGPLRVIPLQSYCEQQLGGGLLHGWCLLYRLHRCDPKVGTRPDLHQEVAGLEVRRAGT